MPWSEIWDMPIGEAFQYIAFTMEYNKRQQDFANEHLKRRTY